MQPLLDFLRSLLVEFGGDQDLANDIDNQQWLAREWVQENQIAEIDSDPRQTGNYRVAERTREHAKHLRRHRCRRAIRNGMMAPPTKGVSPQLSGRERPPNMCVLRPWDYSSGYCNYLRPGVVPSVVEVSLHGSKA